MWHSNVCLYIHMVVFTFFFFCHIHSRVRHVRSYVCYAAPDESCGLLQKPLRIQIFQIHRWHSQVWDVNLNIVAFTCVTWIFTCHSRTWRHARTVLSCVYSYVIFMCGIHIYDIHMHILNSYVAFTYGVIMCTFIHYIHTWHSHGEVGGWGRVPFSRIQWALRPVVNGT